MESKDHYKFDFYSSYWQQEIGSLKSLKEGYLLGINFFLFLWRTTGKSGLYQQKDD